ncbi:hypothetical protein PSEWESI4_04208 [Pseudomonas carbonaria]|uniref:Uncharacterized protein n=1 Tax=Zestomonas carbonaria TaxID=2762745 RepID=A0A7U7ERL8_9GAMM|nr:hypothetical protein PSEWESI4_04208 [Pseudomonas carbonaria]
MGTRGHDHQVNYIEFNVGDIVRGKAIRPGSPPIILYADDLALWPAAE